MGICEQCGEDTLVLRVNGVMLCEDCDNAQIGDEDYNDYMYNNEENENDDNLVGAKK